MHSSSSQNIVKDPVWACDNNKTAGRTYKCFFLILDPLLIYLLYLRLDYTDFFSYCHLPDINAIHR